MAKNSSQLRSKFGYLNYEDIQLRIDSGDLDAWDVVYCKDQKNIYLLDGDCNLIEMRSKVKCFSSVADAIVKINKDVSTYEGELISILSDDKVTYRGYIVNGTSGNYTVTPLYEHDKKIDYNQLINQPIKNIENSFRDDEEELLRLKDGFYEIKGWLLCPDGEEIYSIAGNIVIVETRGNIKYIKRIATDSITNYAVSGISLLGKASYITDEYLEQQGYVRDEYVDAKLEVMEATIMQNVRDYIESTFEVLIEHVVENKLEQAEATKEDIDSLFDFVPDDEINLFF